MVERDGEGMPSTRTMVAAGVDLREKEAWMVGGSIEGGEDGLCRVVDRRGEMSVKRNSSTRVVGMRRVERASREEARSLSRRGVAGVVGRVVSNVLATHLSSDVT